LEEDSPPLGASVIGALRREVKVETVWSVELPVPLGTMVFPNPRILFDAVTGLFDLGSEGGKQRTAAGNELAVGHKHLLGVVVKMESLYNYFRVVV
tara:strand:+ start:2128 stop:2415 length:288 start_codon:yes stop_codon:yes gene_type:complete